MISPIPPAVRWARMLLWLPLFACLSLAAMADEGGSNLERQVKAAMIYKFLGYVEWPPGVFATPASPYVIAVAGAADVVDELRRITQDRTINQRLIVVQKVNSRSDLNRIHLLFIGDEYNKTLHSRLIRRAREHSMVTVTEVESGLDLGSVINFRLIDNRIGFDISLPNAGVQQVKLSARLLSVASNVETGSL
ncbi:MAG: YfiR family protein [Cellvibrionaceae bacterium]|nr:YfiR family protein [Cellvibrionaceae bacterium]